MKLTNDTLEGIVREYQANPNNENGKKLGLAIGKLVSNVCKVFACGVTPKRFLSRDVKRRCVLKCFEKTEVFSHTKGGKAFSYFMISILNQMRQQYRIFKNELLTEYRFGDLVPRRIA